MKKCIIFTRVSTEHQEFVEQERTLSELALKDGYARESQIFISNKESAIKLSEEERSGLNELKMKISTDEQIDAVYAFDISRISRQQKIIYSVRDFLIDRHVQLVFHTPSIRLFDAQGNIDAAAELAFSMFAVMAEQEMRLKKARVAAGRRRSRKEGKFWGGPSAGLGFKINEETRKVEPDPEMIPILIELFELYTNEGYSIVQLRNWLSDRGIEYSGQNIKLLLTRKSVRNLVGEELFDRAQKIRIVRSTTGGESKKRKYSICESLIKCPVCGRFYTIRSNHTYNCVYHDAQRKGTPLFCNNSVGLSSRRMDAILINVASEWMIKYVMIDDAKRRKLLEDKLKDLPKIIETLQKRLEGIESRIERIIDNFESNLITKIKRDQKIRKVREEEADVKEKLLSKISEREYLLARKDNKIETFVDLINRFDNMDQKELYFMVHEYIDSVTLTINQQEKIITVKGKAGDVREFAFVGQARGFRLYQIMKGGRIDVTDVPAFKRED